MIICDRVFGWIYAVFSSFLALLPPYMYPSTSLLDVLLYYYYLGGYRKHTCSYENMIMKSDPYPVVSRG